MVRPGQAGEAAWQPAGAWRSWPEWGHVVASMDKWSDSPRRTHHWQHNGELAEGVLSPRIHPHGPYEGLKVSVDYCGYLGTKALRKG